MILKFYYHRLLTLEAACGLSINLRFFKIQFTGMKSLFTKKLDNFDSVLFTNIFKLENQAIGYLLKKLNIFSPKTDVNVTSKVF